MVAAIRKTLKTLKLSLPILLGVFLLVNLISPLFERFYPKIFTGNFFLDPLLGALGGSIAFGMPLTSYIIGGELLNEGVSLIAVSAFILAWSTVGIAMLPLEISALGKRFAIARNILNFIFAVIISILVILIIN